MRRRGVRLSERAADDLTAIYDYVADTNPDAGGRVIKGITAKIKAIAASGLTGVSREHMKPGLRMIAVRNHLVYFRVTASHVFVLRILHGRQDISSKDFPESET